MLRRGVTFFLQMRGSSVIRAVSPGAWSCSVYLDRERRRVFVVFVVSALQEVCDTGFRF